MALIPCCRRSTPPPTAWAVRLPTLWATSAPAAAASKPAAVAQAPLAVLDLPDAASLTDGRTSVDLVRLDATRGVEAATGMAPGILRTPYRWGPEGLVVSADAPPLPDLLGENLPLITDLEMFI